LTTKRGNSMGKVAETLIARCPACGTENRITPQKAAKHQPICGRCKKPLPSPVSAPVIVTDTNFDDIVGRSHVPVLLDLWAAWCGPCRILAPTIDSLAKELAGKVLVGKIDVDANPRTAARFRVQSIPTLLILNEGREIERIVGVHSKEAILSKLSQLI
jgi:thioredoxin 2